MSQLSQLKQAVNGCASSATKASSNLASFGKEFGKQTQQVQQLIGGSAQGKDKQVVAAIQRAEKAVKDAAAQLQNAAKIAQQYGQSL
jgi:flavin-binding protein dodecin